MSPRPPIGDLREQARLRAAGRPRVPAVAAVTGLAVAGTRMRRYASGAPPRGPWVAVFAHGGYFVLGDLDLQDQYCRRLALAIGGEVLSVDYALAPEHTAADSVADVVAGARAARAGSPAARVLLCGDSAGGAVAFLAAAALRDAGAPADALFLSNPNADLTMAMFDHGAPAGPDPDLLRWAIRAWAGPDPAGAGLSPLHAALAGLPPALVAVGALDALRPEAAALERALRAAGTAARLLVHDEAGHGFMGGATAPEAAARDATLTALAAFLAAA